MRWRDARLAALLAIACFLPAAGQAGIRIKIGSNASSFHMPQNFMGREIMVEQPTNEHTVFAVEDLIGAAGAKNDILVGGTQAQISNAYAVILGAGSSARRMIVFDEAWFARISAASADYHIILAHEVGHHVCKHTLPAYYQNPWDKELEADRTGAALLRRLFDNGSSTIDYATLVRTVAIVNGGPGSPTHPPGNMRVQASIDGWNSGSPCLTQVYMPLNPPPPYEPTMVQRIVDRYGLASEWCYFGATLNQTGSCGPSNPRVHMQIRDGTLQLTLSQPNSVPVGGVFPPDYQRIALGTLLFEAGSDKSEVKGTFWHYVVGCQPVSYEVKGNFVENNGLFLVGEVPKMDGCTKIGAYASTLHFFKNVEDIIPLR
jgi:hypothetical protein